MLQDCLNVVLQVLTLLLLLWSRSTHKRYYKGLFFFFLIAPIKIKPVHRNAENASGLVMLELTRLRLCGTVCLPSEKKKEWARTAEIATGSKKDLNWPP